MGYRATHFKHFVFRIFRDESRKGNLKRLCIAVALASLTVSLRLILPSEFDENLLLRTLFSLRGEQVPPADLVVVQIDDASYQKLNVSSRKPFPRVMSGRALKAIMREKPRFVFLDLDVPMEEDEDEGLRMLAEAMAMGPVSIGRFYVDNSKPELGFFDSAPEVREVARFELPMQLNYWNRLAKYIHVNPFKSLSDGGESMQYLKPLREYVSEDIRAPGAFDLINFYGPADTLRSFSLWEFFSEDRRIPKGFFTDKIVVVGFKSNMRERGNSPKETFHIPFTRGSINEMYGVEIHAQIIANLIDGTWIRKAGDLFEFTFLFVALFVLTIGILQLSPFAGLLYALGYLSIWFLGSFVAFACFRFFLPGFYLALLASTFIIGGASCASATIALRELRELKRALGVD